MKASSLCAASAFLVLGGFMAVNLAGCGGGGGGGGFNSPTPTSGPRTVTFHLQLQDGSASNRGTVSVTGPITASTTADATGLATLTGLTAGTYTVTYTVVDEGGVTLSTTTNTIVVTSSDSQNFLLIQDNTSPATFSIQGIVRQNPIGSDDPDTNPATSNCTTSSIPSTDNFLVSVIDLDSTLGQPIIAQVKRSAQPSTTTPSKKGIFNVAVPYRPRNFRIRISQFDTSGNRLAGISANTNFPSTVTTVTGVAVCVNSTGISPTPAPTLSPTFTPTGSPTATPNPSATPTTAPTATTAP